MAPKKIITHVPFPIFLTDTVPEPSDETGIISPPASPTAFVRTRNMLGLVGVPTPAGQELATGYERAVNTDNFRTSDRTHGLVFGQDNQDSEAAASSDDRDEEEEYVSASVGLVSSHQGPPAILRHGAFVAPLPEVDLVLPPPQQFSLISTCTYRLTNLVPLPMEGLSPETLNTRIRRAGERIVSARQPMRDDGAESAQELEEKADASDLLAAWTEEPESELEDELLDCEEKVLNSLSFQTAVKRPSAPVLVQPRSDGQAEVRLVLEDGDGFLDDIEDYINGDFDMFSFRALSEMMGSPVKSTGDWVEQTSSAVASFKPGDMQLMVELCPDRSLDAFAGLAGGEEAYRPATPLGISESDEENLNRPMSPSGDGDSDVTAVEIVSSASFGPSVPGTVDGVEPNAAHNSGATTLPSTSGDSASSARSASISPLLASPKVSSPHPRIAEKPVDPTSPAASGRPGPSQRSSISPLLSIPATLVPDVLRASTSQTAQTAALKRKASDADLDETKDVKGKGKALESVKRQRLLLRKPSNASVESM